jgi:HlyD family secretion protein
VDVGQTVAASFNTPTLFTLAGDMREMRVQAAVDEADIGKVQAGQKAEFTVDAYPDSLFFGEVEQVRLQPKTEQNVVTYDVVIRAPNPHLKLMPGMTANLTIAVARKEDVLWVPAAALRFRPPRVEKPAGESARPRENGERAGRNGSGGRVFVLESDRPSMVRVQVGLTDGAKTEIQGPIQPGAVVLVGVDSSGGSNSGGTPFGLPSGRQRRRM